MNKVTLPIFDFDIDENDETDLGLTCVSFVDRPAVNRKSLKFKEEVESKVNLKYSLNEDKMIITSVALLADTPIYRYDEDTDFEYYTNFTKNTIQKLVKKFFKEGKIDQMNINHTAENKIIDGAYLFESYIVNKELGINPEILEATEGSWITSYQVTDKNLWKQIKEGDINGFSVEVTGFLSKFTSMKPKVELKDIGFLGNDLYSKIFINHLNKSIIK